MGRPTVFDQAVADKICGRLAEGEGLKTICRDDGMPSESTVRGWALDDREGFAAPYARARRIGTERLAEEILAISDDGANDTYTDDDGQRRTDYDVIARSKLRVDTRKFLLAKLLPATYGDKVQHTGADGESPVGFVVFGQRENETPDEWLKQHGPKPPE